MPGVMMAAGMLPRTSPAVNDRPRRIGCRITSKYPALTTRNPATPATWSARRGRRTGPDSLPQSNG